MLHPFDISKIRDDFHCGSIPHLPIVFGEHDELVISLQETFPQPHHEMPFQRTSEHLPVHNLQSFIREMNHVDARNVPECERQDVRHQLHTFIDDYIRFHILYNPPHVTVKNWHGHDSPAERGRAVSHIYRMQPDVRMQTVERHFTLLPVIGDMYLIRTLRQGSQIIGLVDQYTLNASTVGQAVHKIKQFHR